MAEITTDRDGIASHGAGIDGFNYFWWDGGFPGVPHPADIAHIVTSRYRLDLSRTPTRPS